MNRYYLTQRGPGPGTIPKVWDNQATNIEDFGSKKYVDEIKGKAWGYVDYMYPLTSHQIDAYELADVETITCKNCGIMKVTSFDFATDIAEDVKTTIQVCKYCGEAVVDVGPIDEDDCYGI